MLDFGNNFDQNISQKIYIKKASNVSSFLKQNKISISFMVIYRSVMEDDSYSRTWSFTNKKHEEKTTANYVTSKELSVIVFSLTQEIVFVIHGNNYILYSNNQAQLMIA